MRRIHYGWVVLFTSVLTVMSALGLARFGYSPILPAMQEGLGIDNTETGLIATGNFIGYLSMALIGGFLASRYSPRLVISISLAVVAGMMLLTGFSQNLRSAIFFRVLTGIGSGSSNVPVMGLLAAWFASNRRGLATGIAVAGSSLGLIVTGRLIPYILTTYPDNGWRLSWWVLGGMGLVISLLAYLLLRDNPKEKQLIPIGSIPDNDGTPRRRQTEKNERPKGFKGWGLVVKSGVVWHLSLIYLAFGFSYIIYLTFFAKYLQAERSYTPTAAGSLWGIVGWTSLFCGVIWGWFSDRFGRKYALAVVSFIQGCAYILFAVRPDSMGLTISAVMFGLTAWSIPAIMASACGDHVGSRLAPAALGFITVFFGIGQALGPSTAGMIADYTGFFGPAFIAAAASSFIGTAASLFLRKTNRAQLS